MFKQIIAITCIFAVVFAQDLDTLTHQKKVELCYGTISHTLNAARTIVEDKNPFDVELNWKSTIGQL